MSLGSSLRNLYWYSDSARRFWRNERSNEVLKPLSHRLRWFRRGFHTYSSTLYGLGEENWRQYISDFARYQLIRLNGRSSDILDDKLLFARVFGPHVNVTRVLARVVGGRGRSLDPELGVGREVTIEEVLSASPKGVAIKPNPGGGGRGVRVVSQDDRGLRLDDQPVGLPELRELWSRLDRMLVVERLVQHPFSAAIFPKTVNSIRVTTLVDPKTGRAFAAGAAWRFGVERSIPVDNWDSGGICAGVHLETGELMPAARFTERPVPVVDRLDAHPETGARITGIRIPGWAAVMERVLRTADLFSMYPVLGWDLVLTEEGFSVLEINSAPGVQILQVHRPLLADPRVRRVVEQSRILTDPTGRSALQLNQGPR